MVFDEGGEVKGEGGGGGGKKGREGGIRGSFKVVFEESCGCF